MKRLILRSVLLACAIAAVSHNVVAQKIAIVADRLYTMSWTRNNPAPQQKII